MPGRTASWNRLLFGALAGAWYGSMTLMFVGLPVLVLTVLATGREPAWAVWGAAMMIMLVLSLRVRGRAEPPGRPLARDEAPRLHALVEEARRVAGIGPVGEIRLTALPNVGVTRVFRGGILYTRPVKVLLVGLPYLRSLTVQELEAILLHEFGHFLGEDVHRGERLATIEARTGNLRNAFDRTGILRWGNPVYLWVRLYQSVFTLATASLRRNQEILADALAARTCGPTVYSRGLLKAAATRRIFARVAARRVLLAMRDGGVPPRNLFLEFRLGVRAMTPEDRRRALREAREAPEPPLSWHPPLAARLERLGRLHVPRRRAREERSAHLVPGLEGIEEGMTPEAVRIVLATLESSQEEATAIRAEVDRLLAGGTFTNAQGIARPLTPADILVVAPYNMQVHCLRERLLDGVEVGTVDKFQGREAPIVFFSMASSSGEDVLRGLDFLFMRNRLNVAMSRARALAILVASPKLLEARCSSLEQMRRVNNVSRFAEQSGFEAAK